MTSSPVMNVTSSEAPSTPAAPSDQACYLLTLAVSDSFYLIGYTSKQHVCTALYSELLECGPMPNVMDALPSIGGALCSTPQSLADTHY